MDTYNKLQIKKLHPSIRDEVATIINACDISLTGKAKIRITSGLRTLEEQNLLYGQGRTLKGKKTANAKGGQSIHNYGFVVDNCLIISGKTASWDTVKDWDNDLPHFDKRGHNNWRQLIKLKQDKNGYAILKK